MTKHCDDHGDYEVLAGSFMGIEVECRCPGCVDEALAENAKKLLAQDKADNEAFIRGLISNANIPDRFKNASLLSYEATTPEQKQALKVCDIYSNDLLKNDLSVKPGSGDALFLLGNYGTGKTHLAIGILNRVLRRGISGIYTETLQMIRDIRSSYGDHSKSEQGLIDKYVYTKLLVLDELGVQFGTEAEKILLFEVLNGRYKLSKPTIIISNLEVSEVTNYLGDRVYDRLRSGNSQLVVMEWKSYRMRENDE